jgi:hypothetical protein
MGSTWTRKQRLIFLIGLALGVAVALGTFHFFVHLIGLAPWRWLRTVLFAAFVISFLCLWPTLLAIAVCLNFYCLITREDPGRDFFRVGSCTSGLRRHHLLCSLHRFHKCSRV